ncbi:MAG: cob(I)yrinic acid a,c-diamide adenosyltransferase [Bacteriovoracaceae bacterium]|nr:cob(I)yrinic acid a,c-diamide adenosyltransferase [Bacteriovoracaceae bacterium]
MTKSKVYTRGGDKGKTGLVSGTRVSKGSIRLGLYGEVDSLNSQIGLMICELENEKIFLNDIEFFIKIQRKLFDMGSLLACEAEHHEKYKLNSFTSKHVLEIEEKIDLYDNQLEPMTAFILPGGSRAASVGHICRTTCRGLERKLVEYYESGEDTLSDHMMEYVNRLSDFLFVYCRYINKKNGIKEKNWMSH